MCKSKVSAKARKCSGGRLTQDHNKQTWFGAGFSFCYRRHEACKVPSNAIAIELRCPFKEHGKCRKRMHFKTHGGVSKVEQRLKYWLVEGKPCKDHRTHRDMKFPKVLPSFEELDARASKLLGDKLKQ